MNMGIPRCDAFGEPPFQAPHFTLLRSAPLRAPPSTPASQKRGPRHSILDPNP